MQLIKKYGFLILTTIFMLIGFLTLKFSVDFGSRAASAYFSSKGTYGIDLAEFNAIHSKYIISHMIIGGILFSLGTIFLFFSVYKLSKKNS